MNRHPISYLAAWLIVLAFALSACSPSQASIETAIAQTQIAAITDTPVYTATPSATATEPSATPTIAPSPTHTRTPRPTSTPRPTATHTRVPTNTPIPDPILLEGQGDSVVEVTKGPWPALGRINYDGSGNFAVWNYGRNGERIDLLVNHIGTYSGTVPIDFLANEHTARFEITGRGTWRIEVLPLNYVRRVNIPSTFTGEGDEIVALVGSNPDVLEVDASLARSNLAIWAYGGRRDLLVNEIAPYQGTVVIPVNTVLLVIKAEGPWSLKVTTR